MMTEAVDTNVANRETTTETDRSLMDDTDLFLEIEKIEVHPNESLETKLRNLTDKTDQHQDIQHLDTEADQDQMKEGQAHHTTKNMVNTTQTENM